MAVNRCVLSLFTAAELKEVWGGASLGGPQLADWKANTEYNFGLSAASKEASPARPRQGCSPPTTRITYHCLLAPHLPAGCRLLATPVAAAARQRPTDHRSAGLQLRTACRIPPCSCELTRHRAAARQVMWFWEIVEGGDEKLRAAVLKFATGTARAPLDGFAQLRQGAKDGAVKKFTLFGTGELAGVVNMHDMDDQIRRAQLESVMHGMGQGGTTFRAQVRRTCSVPTRAAAKSCCVRRRLGCARLPPERTAAAAFEGCCSNTKRWLWRRAVAHRCSWRPSCRWLTHRPPARPQTCINTLRLPPTANFRDLDHYRQMLLLSISHNSIDNA